MKCEEFYEYIVSNRPLKDSLPDGPPSDHAKRCRKCGVLYSFLEVTPELEKERLTPAEAEKLWDSITDAAAEAVSKEQRRPAWIPGLLPAAALIALALIVGAFFYFHDLPTLPETEPPGETVKKVEMYIHKTGTPESEASYLYLEVHQKGKEKP